MVKPTPGACQHEISRNCFWVLVDLEICDYKVQLAIAFAFGAPLPRGAVSSNTLIWVLETVKIGSRSARFGPIRRQISC